MEVCKICLSDIGHENIVKLTEKGAQSVNSSSEKRQSDIRVTAGDIVHSKCRKNHINKNYIDSYIRQKEKISQTDITSPTEGLKRKLRSEGDASHFDTKTHCFLCGLQKDIDVTKDDPNFSRVKTSEFTKTIEKKCEERGDLWATEVKARLSYSPDCFAADAVYHRLCYSAFLHGQNPPVEMRDESLFKHIKLGRPVDSRRESAFLKVIDYLKENGKLSLEKWTET